MNVVGIAVIGKQNNPLYLPQKLEYHYLAHCCLDLMESNENYLGLLTTMQDVAVFGYQFNRYKIMIMTKLQDTITRDQEMIKAFKRIHLLVLRVINNPFYDPDSTEMIQSAMFERELSKMLTV
ncbi:Sedlin [Gorgonomyces haynaldii]|nr:Sedlin [Gorgonomyces haynaldii]